MFPHESTYVIAGGLGGLGRCITRWMVRRGAQHFLLLSHPGTEEPEARAFVQSMRSEGIQVEVPCCDIGDAENLRSVLEACILHMPPIRRCIQADMVLRNSILENMKHGEFNAALDAKVKGSCNLRSLLPLGLKFIIMLSLVAVIYGSGGQANYTAGNTYQDALAAYRVSLGQRLLRLT
ncbi:polyketide synthase [Lentithecium fluviatile CBS 122367]|uniref:Polyketide synthase n=1 Tax=Lentithecium fluviatile CBS 122367 TaxID=1168545 RepID=A0A6G1J084_9PLEO|nr:polyketide synthase [Lentithecium fluviatile CBS 122367]